MPALAFDFVGSRTFDATVRERQPRRVTVQCPSGLPAGAKIKVVLGNWRSFKDGHPAYELHWFLNNVAVTNGAGAAVMSMRSPESFDDIEKSVFGRKPFRVVIGEATVTEDVAENGEITFTFNAKLSGHAGFHAFISVHAQIDPDAPVEQVGDEIALENHAGPPARFEVRPGPVDAAGRFSLTIFATDILLNPAENYEASIRIEPDERVENLPENIEIADGDSGRVRIEGLRALGERPIRLTLHDTTHDWLAFTPPIVPAKVGGMSIYYGEIHWHTDFSDDGDNTLENAYIYARDCLNLGVASVSDHTPKNFWKQTIETNNRFHKDGEFAVINGWEWSTRHGHANLYLRDENVPASPDHFDEWTEKFPWEHEWPEGTVMVPHHTNIRALELREDGTPYWFEYDWSGRNPAIRLVEIKQTRGNFECDRYDADWGVVTAELGTSVRDALAMGYRIGFTAGTDNHTGYPARDGCIYGKYCGMTGFIAPELTREAIWQSMHRRHTFGTTGVPIYIHCEINGNLMGSEAKLSPNDKVALNARLYGTAPIERVEIISNDRCIWQSLPNALDVALDGISLPRQEEDTAYYYLRLRQSDGHMGWASPVWLDKKT